MHIIMSVKGIRDFEKQCTKRKLGFVSPTKRNCLYYEDGEFKTCFST